MLIIIHRINTIKELKKVPQEYGVEVDVRGYNNKLILNHKPLEKGEELENYLSKYVHSFIIFNIKEAGIENKVIELANKYRINHYFLLDVEFPYLYDATRKQGVTKIAVRYSEAEPIEMALAQKGLLNWVWIDTNTKFPLSIKDYRKLRAGNFKLCLVCPERWGRPEDIHKYKKIMDESNIKLDAVMTSLKYANKWEGNY